MSNQISADSSTSSMWGGRFSEATDSFVAEFTASVGFDQRFANQDIAGSIAHATMLAKAGIITEADKDQIVGGLTQIKQEIADGKFVWSVALEDVHMNVESRLTAIIGDVGKKLHTGRSRNDQVATDIRLYLRDQTDIILGLLKRLQMGLLDLASQHTDTIMPGFTHLQTAQPVSFGHHVMAWFEMLMRDSERLIDGRKRINQMPLGAAALAGTTYPIEREFTAELLGFEGICQNSLDAVSDRDFAIEFASSASLLMMHLSRMSEEIILWMSAQFGFVVVPDRFCTGSSIMPQKKNPDVPELVRGKAARVFGDMITDLVRLNKSFIVKRGVSVREMLDTSKQLSEYIFHTVNHRQTSLWIAQREGRAKDSDDRTQTGLLKMLTLHNAANPVETLRTLNIVPLSLSYEFDPCDFLKAKEFQMKRDNPEYKKTKADDVENMVTGIQGYKGRGKFQVWNTRQ